MSTVKTKGWGEKTKTVLSFNSKGTKILLP